MDRDPIVLFVGGYGRSGSTLLDRLLGSYGPGVVSAGELRHLWREGLGEDRRCACGAPFSACPFWRAVLAEAFGPAGPPPAAELLALQAAVDRPRYIPLLATGRPPARFAAALDRYTDVQRRLLRAIAAVAGARVVVDSTKDPSHGWVLRRTTGIDLRVLQLTRDPRAVAWSWQRRRHNPGSGEDMDRYSLVRTGAGWVAVNALVAALRQAGPPSLTVRYEDLVADPSGVVGDALAFVGEDRAAAAALAGGTAVLAEDHTVAGNPVRFRNGAMTLRTDDEWRTAMPAGARSLVGAMTLPARLALTGPPSRQDGAAPAGSWSATPAARERQRARPRCGGDRTSPEQPSS